MKEIKFRLEYHEEKGHFHHNVSKRNAPGTHGWNTIAEDVTNDDYKHFIIFLGFNEPQLHWSFKYDYSYKYMRMQWVKFKKFQNLLTERGYKIQKVNEHTITTATT
jgi:hypothetical protein